MGSIQGLKKEIFGDKLSGLYIFTGEEIAIRNMYMDEMKKVAKAETVYAECMQEVIKRVQTKALTQNSRRIYIVIDDGDWLKQEKVWNKIKEQKIYEPNILIMIYNKVDKRSKFFKHFSDYIYAFDKIAPEILVAQLKHTNKITEGVGKRLVEWCDCDYARILLEVDKANVYAKAANIKTLDSAITELIDKEVITKAGSTAIFTLTDTILARQANYAYELLQTLENPAQNAILAVSVLYNAIKNAIFIVGKENAGLNGFILHKTKQFASKYSMQELVERLEFLRTAEQEIKNGILPAEIALDYIIAKVV